MDLEVTPVLSNEPPPDADETRRLREELGRTGGDLRAARRRTRVRVRDPDGVAVGWRRPRDVSSRLAWAAAAVPPAVAVCAAAKSGDPRMALCLVPAVVASAIAYLAVEAARSGERRQ